MRKIEGTKQQLLLIVRILLMIINLFKNVLNLELMVSYLNHALRINYQNY